MLLSGYGIQIMIKKTKKRTEAAYGIIPTNPSFRGVFSWKEASRTGIPRRAFQKMISDGTVQQVRRGYYTHKDSKLSPEFRDFAVGCKHFGPQAAVGGLTALFHYGLTEVVPRQIWVLVPSQRRSGPPLFRCIRTKVPSNVGIMDYGFYRITSIERTIVDSFKFSTKTGLSNAVRAARTAIAERKTTATKIAQVAKNMGQFKVIQKYWESFT